MDGLSNSLGTKDGGSPGEPLVITGVVPEIICFTGTLICFKAELW